MRRRVSWYGLACAVLLAVLAGVVFLNGGSRFYTDIKPEVYLSPFSTLKQYLSPWLSSPYLGNPNFNVGLTPVLVVTSALRGVGLSAVVTYKILHFALWALSAWGAARLLRALAPRAGRWAALAAGTAYLVNPYAVVGGSTLAIALPMALLPWMILALVRGLQSPRSWAWPAAFGLAFFGMSGMNVGVVPILQLLFLLPVVICVAKAFHVGWRAALAVLGKCAAFVVALSLYWIIPSVGALSVGSQVASSSETLDGIAKVSSMVEVLRGLGMWSLYGHSDAGPWVPQFATYITSPVLVILTLLWPITALLALAVAPPLVRRISAAGIALSAIVMVGLFPSTGDSPFAKALGWAFEHLPGLIAFRTTNKIGAVLALCCALALGAAAPRVWRSVARRPGAAPLAAPLVAIIAVVWALPAFSGRLYTSEMQIPDYWRQAAQLIDSRGDTSRVLFLPGQLRANYRWTPDRPDDVANSLLTREAIIPETSTNTSAWGSNFLAALDDSLQSGDTPGRSVATMARYLGAGDLLLRHDVRWEAAGGARPLTLADTLSTAPGLIGVANVGAPGENVVGVGESNVPPAERQLPPLQLYSVVDPRATVRAEPLANGLIVVGDAWSIPAMSAAGLSDAAPLLRYAGDLFAKEFEQALRQGSHLVITDTNQRRSLIANRLTDGFGSLVAPTEDPGPTRALFSAQDQTTLREIGAKATATSRGGAFFDLPYAAPANVLDGDPTTSWLFGDFGRAPGTQLTVTLPRAQTLGTIQVQQAARGDLRINQIEVKAAGRTVTAALDPTKPTPIDLGGVRTDKVQILIKSTSGSGYGLVGLSDVAIPGVTNTRVGVVPNTLSRLATELPDSARQELDSSPLDVILTRTLGGPDLTDDAETYLARDFTMPSERAAATRAWVRIDDLSDKTYDAFSGFTDAVSARSSGTWFGDPRRRASMAADGSPSTSWIPALPSAGAWWEITGPRRAIPAVTLTQETARAGAATATQVSIVIDGKRVRTATIGAGEARVSLPAGTSGSTVRVVIDAVDRPEADTPPRFVSIDAGVSMMKSVAPHCIPVATLDGSSLMMRPEDPTVLAGAKTSGVPFVGCGRTQLTAAAHELRPVSGVTLDRIAFLDEANTRTTLPTQPTPVQTTGRATNMEATVTVGPKPVALVIGQGFDARWNASIDGTSLGKPQVLDGFSAGWIIDTPGTHQVTVRFGGQTPALIGYAVSGLAFLVAIAVFLVGILRRRTSRDEASMVLAGASFTAHRPALSPRRRAAGEVALVIAGGLALGWPGLVACAILVALGRQRRIAFSRGLILGVALIAVGGLIQVWVTRATWGQVSADAVSLSLWPHRVAATGLLLACLTACLLPSARSQRSS